MSAAFILVNSIAGLAGAFSSVRSLPPSVYSWRGAAAVGGLIGTELGARRFGTRSLRFVLAAVLVIAVLKLIGAAVTARRGEGPPAWVVVRGGVDQ